jgi:hypothetical protein
MASAVNKRLLGHSKINMVLRYAHPTQEHQTKAMEKMEQFVAQKQTGRGWSVVSDSGLSHPRNQDVQWRHGE